MNKLIDDIVMTFFPFSIGTFFVTGKVGVLTPTQPTVIISLIALDMTACRILTLEHHVH